ncbi:hypothetical protein TH3_11495 [Thalassospira xiamenensis M-5 = DSM 17429]|uniref:Uncharacterized protein n=1 Tax=Thalassospira xiamenensis M-5 = DSM 17429 TaxID=1123366 RepID=A0AB72UDP8_9PROT|nr:hypothetical protein TH3_11495 [Thalassospira xiamenensis M-5 = DSM 17429]
MILWRYRRLPFCLSDRGSVIVVTSIILFLSFRPEYAKTRESESRFAGFGSGCISPVDFSLMPQMKEQIKNNFQGICKKS